MKKIELIELGLNEIARECRIIDSVAVSCQYSNDMRIAKGKGSDYTFEHIIKQHEEILSEVHEKVVALLDYVAEVMNAGEMVTATDAAISKPIFDLVYERKTEDDFEDEGEVEEMKF